MSIRELHQLAVSWQFYELAEELLDIMDSVIYYGARPGDAQDAVEAVRIEVEDLIAEARQNYEPEGYEAPTAESLACRFGGFECEGCE